MKIKVAAVFAVTLACAMVTAAPPSAAQDAATTGAAAALFDEGAALMESGKYAEACPKLARSQELSPNGGTLLALADCYEKTGKVASAWVAYKEAAIRANAAKRADAEALALAAAKRLEPRVSKLTVTVPGESDVEGLALSRDGRPLGRPEWGVALPIDPGEHVIRATAPGRKPWTKGLRFGKTGETHAVRVPALEREPAAVASTGPVTGEEGAPRGGAQRVVGLSIGGVGLVGLGLGAFFGMTAASKNDEAAQHCRDGTACSAEGIRLDGEARDAATISTIAFIAGGAAVVSGAILFFTAPRGREPSAALGFRGTRGGGALTLGGRF
jgi:hypothetical protein